ncbi:MAG TPA: exodeoxyribonuclease VII large subunit [Rectinemataceae bacterium]|nr:exodeoxyribonuclease VII large subunit [Rectinemataceae bacterium]
MTESREHVFGVSELTSRIGSLLEGSFPAVTVEGEISNCRPASSGHLYFSLKDKASVIQAVMFRYRTRGLAFEPADGLLVRARGAVTVYAARGQYQILVERLEKAGVGDILAMLEQRKRALAAEGLFDEDRKRPLPRSPERIAVITSPTGAAVRDILNVLSRRNAGLGVVILPAAVQGDEAPAQIVRQIQVANRWRLGDVIILGRGGGSLEDLLAFSDEAVVRAVAASAIPVISAVGHEVDWALTDFAADMRAPTPSAAAELVSESRESLARQVAQFRGELETAVASRLDRARLLLGRFDPRAVEAQFMRILLPAVRSFDEARDDLARGMTDAIAAMRRRIELASRDLAATSPEAVLARGFAVVTPHAGGPAIRDSAGLGPGAELDIRFARGSAAARVLEARK